MLLHFFYFIFKAGRPPKPFIFLPTNTHTWSNTPQRPMSDFFGYIPIIRPAQVFFGNKPLFLNSHCFEIAKTAASELWIKFANRLAGYIKGIVSHARWPLHTSLLEGMNNKIKVLKRMAYGWPNIPPPSNPFSWPFHINTFGSSLLWMDRNRPELFLNHDLRSLLNRAFGSIFCENYLHFVSGFANYRPLRLRDRITGCSGSKSC